MSPVSHSCTSTGDTPAQRSSSPNHSDHCGLVWARSVLSSEPPYRGVSFWVNGNTGKMTTASCINVEVESRERGTIVSMGTYRLGGFGHIRADNGDAVAMFYWSLISGFHTLRIGQRVEFSRARYGFNQNVATLVESVITDADFSDHEGS